MTLTYADIAEIIKLIDASSCEEIILDLGEIRLSMRRKGAGGTAETTVTPAASNEAGDGAGGPPPRSAATPDVAEADAPAPMDTGTAEQAPRDGLIEIRSPMVGTFYRAPSPTSPPFVEVGAEVADDDPLCLIEVMKLYTTISANGPGRVIEICAENAAMVSADEILFRIEPL